MTRQLHLTVVSQEKEFITAEVDQITAPTTEGAITILPQHTPLITRLDCGELSYRQNGKNYSLVVSQGFLHLKPKNKVTVIVDAAKDVRQISLKKAQQAMEAAQETLAESKDKHELMIAEASLKQTMWEMRLAQKTKKVQH